MKKAITFILVAAMLSVGALGTFTLNSFAAHHKKEATMGTVTGTITKITSHNLTLKDKSGKHHVVGYSSASMVQGLKVGDDVTVEYQNGKATSIKKAEASTTPESNKPM
jgi:hypothetical protein